MDLILDNIVSDYPIMFRLCFPLILWDSRFIHIDSRNN